jgi:hypothetical protein
MAWKDSCKKRNNCTILLSKKNAWYDPVRSWISTSLQHSSKCYLLLRRSDGVLTAELPVPCSLSLSPTPTSPMMRRSATWSPPAGTNARRWHAPTMVEGRRFGPGPRRWKGRCKGEATTARETGAEPGRGWEGPGKFPLIFWNLKILTSLAPLSFKKSTYWLRLWRESHVEFGGGDIPEI